MTSLVTPLYMYIKTTLEKKTFFLVGDAGNPHKEALKEKKGGDTRQKQVKVTGHSKIEFFLQGVLGVFMQNGTN